MPDNNKHLIHVRSNQTLEDGSPKLPSVDRIEYGEIAVNYNAGKETISFKNSNNEIVAFGDEVVIGTSEPSPGSHAEIFIDESVEPITVEIYSKDEIDTMVDTLNQKDSELESELDQKVLRGSETSSTASSILIDESIDPVEVEIYTKAEIDTQVQSLSDTDTNIQSNLNQKVVRGSEDTSTSTDILIDTTESPSAEVYTRQQVDDLFTKLIQLNPTLVWN